MKNKCLIYEIILMICILYYIHIMSDVQKETRKIIIKEAETARILLNTLKAGNDLFDNILQSNEIEVRIMQLLHLRQYSQMYKYAFDDWHKNNNEQSYIDVANTAGELHNLVEHDVYKTTLTTLLILQSNHLNRSVENIHEEYLGKMGELWKKAGLIQKLSLNTGS
uniref:Uncharacterized protein n=1 Tax=viral metagenome TaxID=1070528 RepID=A0A6C0CP46_9ZZZZ